MWVLAVSRMFANIDAMIFTHGVITPLGRHSARAVWKRFNYDGKWERGSQRLERAKVKRGIFPIMWVFGSGSVNKKIVLF